MLSLTDKAFIVVELSFYWRMTLLAKLATFEERGAIDFDRGSKASYRWLMTVPRGDMGVFTWIVYLRDRLNRSLTGTCRRSSSRWKHWPPSVTEISRSLNPFQWRMGNWSNLFTVSVNIWVNTLEKKLLTKHLRYHVATLLALLGAMAATGIFCTIMFTQFTHTSVFLIGYNTLYCIYSCR